MKWVADSTGRFRWRPYYSREELDNECEQIVSSFLREKYGVVSFPISTDDLSIMVERDTSDLDLYADLGGEAEDVEGVTDFFACKKPSVKISKALSENYLKSHRLRATLAHEYGHVKFHHFLWDMSLKDANPGSFWKGLSRQRRRLADFRKKAVQVNDPSVTPALGQAAGPRCKHSSICDAPADDWMEWQAGYAGGALLIPVSTLKKNVEAVVKKWGGAQVLPDSKQGRELVDNIAAAFDVSAEAASARLSNLGLLTGAFDHSPPVKDSVNFTQ
jgi:hypothetical protein